MAKPTVTKRFTEEGRAALQAWESQKAAGTTPSLGSGRKSLQALHDAMAAAAGGGPSPLPRNLIDRARRGDFAK